MATHFPDFALSAPPALTDFAVGFLASGAPGCERKTTWASVATTLMSSGGFLTPSGNLAGLANVGAAQANLGLGALATLNSVNNANWSGTALAVANGGTGATTGSGALSNLGAAASGLIESSGLTLESGYLAGRSTAATGAIEKITVSTGLSLSGGVLTATGAGAPANAFYLISQANGTLTNGIVISDFQGSPDIDVASGSNDEFTQNTSSTPSGWTNVPSGTPDQINTNGNFSQLYMEADGGGGTNLSLRGIYKAMPTAPFTMTVKISDAGLSANHNRMGIFVGEATASGKFTLMFLATASSKV